MHVRMCELMDGCMHSCTDVSTYACMCVCKCACTKLGVYLT